MLRFCLITIGFLILASSSFSQNLQRVDSLKALLALSEVDTIRQKLFYNIGLYLEDFQPDSAEYHYNEALKIARKLNDKKSMARCFFGLAGSNLSKGSYDNSILFYKESLNLHIEMNDTLGWCADYDNMGIALLNMGEIEKAIELRKKSLDIYLRKNDKKLILNAYQWIANCENYRGCNTLALKNYFSALKISEEIKDTISINLSLGNIAGVYRSQKRYNEALEIYAQCLKTFKAMDLKRDESLAYYLIGNIYSDIGDRKKAMENYWLSLKISNEFKDSSNIVYCYNGLGMQYERLKENEKARSFLELSHGIAKKLNMKKSEAIALQVLGLVYSNESNFSHSNSLLFKALEFFKEINDDSNIALCLKYLSDNYEKIGNFENALIYYKKYKVVNDSVENENHSHAILDIEAIYETEKKDKEIVELNIQNKLKEEKAKQQRISSIIVISSILIIGFLSFYFWRKRKNYLFKQKISEVKQEAINAQMSDHFIGNTMNSINKFIEMNDKEKASEYLLLFNRVIRRVLENSFQKFVPLDSDLEVLKSYFDLEKLRFKENSLNLEIKVENGIDPQNILIPPMIFQTLVENSIKHGFRKSEGGTVKVLIRENQNKLECVVEDNGIGRTASMQARSDEDTAIQSYGSRLAERLAIISGGSYSVTDLVNEEGKPSGTRTRLHFPIISL